MKKPTQIFVLNTCPDDAWEIWASFPVTISAEVTVPKFVVEFQIKQAPAAEKK